jgi:SpoVK/Ycf46/Vps4 family AAA+-type ATPase
MDCRITQEMCEAIGWSKLKGYGLDEKEFKSWSREKTLDLASLSPKQIEKLVELLTPIQHIKGVKSRISDCNTWLKAIAGDEKATKAKSVKQFHGMLWLTLSRTPGHRLFAHDSKSGQWLCYYVSQTSFTAEVRTKDRHVPAHAQMTLDWREFGVSHQTSVTFWPQDCLGMTVQEALTGAGYLPETEELRASFLERQDLFLETVAHVGKQYNAVGVATDDCDGNAKRGGGDRDSWWYRRTTDIQMDKGGEPSRVVVDVFFEGEKARSDRTEKININFWDRKAKSDEDFAEVDEGDEDEETTDDITTDEEDKKAIELPIHPALAVFDMRRHLRLRIDIGQLSEYKYDSRLGDKLILPSDSRNLVEMLLAHKAGFRDIVSGKSGGAIIMCAGSPGTGKTLTAEVYAEVMARPLYTVQASQLGLTPEDLESELLKTFARAARWNAILLIDEADVYVHERGDDIQQNAIVGVFLRVLEYYKGVLFLTTNRVDLVDDAILSRCIARIQYDAPTPDNQKLIWKVLAGTAGIDIKDSVIDQVVARFPKMSGRDVKNLLKLAKLVSDARECAITEDVIRFVKRFKPTFSTAGEDDAEVLTLPGVAMRVETSATASEEATGAATEDAADWRTAIMAVFEGGAPHSAADAKEAVAKVAPAVHPNAVTSHLRSLMASGKLERMESGLYRRVF